MRGLGGGRRVGQCTERASLPRVNRTKRRGLHGTGILVINIKKLNSPVTLCLTKTKIKALKLISSSRIDVDGLRHRILCTRTSLKRPGPLYNTHEIRNLGDSMGIRMCPFHLSGGGTKRLVEGCSVIMSKYSGFTAHCLLGSMYGT